MRGWTVLFAAILTCACTRSPPPSGAPTATPPIAVTTTGLPAEAPLIPTLPAERNPRQPAEPSDAAVITQLRSEMRQKEALAKTLWDAASRIDDYFHVGTAFNEVHIPEHSCYVLGRLLGKAEVIDSLRIEYQPDLETATTENAHDLRVMNVSLSNFNSVANHLISLSHDERVLQWNLDCVGSLGIPGSAYVEQKGQPSFYTVKNEGKLLQVLGDIEPGFSQNVIAAVERNPGVKVVALGSGGGSVREALLAGNYIRSKGLETTLWNNCYSACPLVFMAGTQRTNWSPYADLGFHQISVDGTAIPLDDPAYRMIFNYLVHMGIEPRYVLTRMWSAPPTSMTMVDGYDEALCNANITTWVQRGCTSRDFQNEN